MTPVAAIAQSWCLTWMNGICYFSRCSQTILNLQNLIGATVRFELYLRRPVVLTGEEKNGFFQLVDIRRPALGCSGG
jgi:hypothetical protein